jgi:hypothetical protein
MTLPVFVLFCAEKTTFSIVSDGEVGHQIHTKIKNFNNMRIWRYLPKRVNNGEGGGRLAPK